ncbi:MAG: hypothetical protein IPJ69_10950 [Deltaproteobacteria bacterium]|nr:MAG: hypothetical protein IPJ69_10950 [Deltaproteobacteria bacterium]
MSCKQCHQDYPHDTDWRNKENHGQWVLTHGSSNCAGACHGADLSGGLSGVACQSCHSGIYPHNNDWEQNHGATVNRLGKSLCQGCHGNDFRQILAGRNCYSCHADYPHPERTSWIPFAGGHGERVRTLASTNDCKLCHGDNLREVKQDKNCFTCHASYPHQELSPTWGTYEGHGRYVLETLHGSKEECKICHGNDLGGGARGNPSCASCHASYPHPEGWRRPEGQAQGHADYSHSHGTISCATSHCHGVGLVPVAGVTQGPNCTGCHQNYPHIPGWALGENHGRQALIGTNINGCKSCHGAGLDQRTSATLTGHGSCVECHPSYLRHRSAQIVRPEDNHWGPTGNEHAAYILDSAGDRVTRLNDCKKCHGADYNGGISNQSCNSCHQNYPHPEGWRDETHGRAVRENGTTSCAQSACHGTGLVPTSETRGPSCASCHASYPSQHTLPGWNTYNDNGNGHGKRVLIDLNGDKTSCKLCHGEDLRGGSSGRSCFECHANYPHAATGWTWIGPRGERPGHGAAALGGQEARVRNCGSGNCHGPALAGRSIPRSDGTSLDIPSCNFCHRDFPHTSPTWMTMRPVRTAGNHSLAFIADSRSGIDCRRGCHQDSGTQSCVRVCHTDGVSHLTYWFPTPPSMKHGYFFSNIYNSRSTESNCKDCHGHSDIGVDFLTTDQRTSGTPLLSDGSRTSLPDRSDCYGCHWAYPHRSFTTAGGSREDWSMSPLLRLGHVNFVAYSPLFVDNSGSHPALSDPRDVESIASDPRFAEARQNTCAQNGGCHTNRKTTTSAYGLPSGCTPACHIPRS